MALQLKRKESLEEGVHRVIEERVTEAAHELRSRRARGETIHTARKRLKEARAILRLVRDELGESTFDRENRSYRNAARPLSELRDTEAIAQAFARLCARIRTGSASDRSLRSERRSPDGASKCVHASWSTTPPSRRSCAASGAPGRV